MQVQVQKNFFHIPMAFAAGAICTALVGYAVRDAKIPPGSMDGGASVANPGRRLLPPVPAVPPAAKLADAQMPPVPPVPPVASDAQGDLPVSSEVRTSLQVVSTKAAQWLNWRVALDSSLLKLFAQSSQAHPATDPTATTAGSSVVGVSSEASFSDERDLADSWRNEKVLGAPFHTTSILNRFDKLRTVSLREFILGYDLQEKEFRGKHMTHDDKMLVFAVMDADGNGKLDRMEMLKFEGLFAAMVQNFYNMDTDHDGRLSLKELLDHIINDQGQTTDPVQAMNVHREFVVLDVDHDGYLDAEECGGLFLMKYLGILEAQNTLRIPRLSQVMAMFFILDSDHSGTVTKAEMESSKAFTEEQIQKHLEYASLGAGEMLAATYEYSLI